MDYEKEHKKLIGKIKNAYLYAQTNSTKAVLEDILPELNEGKDEKIRKVIYGWINTRPSLFFDNGFSKEEMLAWLEKQGKQILANSAKTGKAESMFREGDWIISNDKKSIYQVIEVKRGIYVIRDNADNHEYHIGIEECEKSGRLWNVSDAKPGDVLVASDGSIFLFGGVDDSACKYYAALTTDNYITINKEAKGGYWETSRAVYPATKEQRDLLFQKMEEAGYMWDAEKKEPKKIEQKSAWSEEDKDFMYHTLSNLTELKDRYGEEYGNVGKCIKWLKSLKDRYAWKPSEEQMRALNWTLSFAYNCGEECSFDLRTLSEQLKKLREE